MEKIYFDDATYIWKTKLNLINKKQLFLEEANSIIKSHLNVKSGSHPYRKDLIEYLNFIDAIKLETKLDEIYQIGVNKCIEIYNENNIDYNKINVGSWINLVRSNNSIQPKFNNGEKYHTHAPITKANGEIVPYYTWIYYIQMPDVMDGEDGVLCFKGENDKEYWIRPEEDDLIVMKADVLHSANNAPQSTINRIVLAGNVGFEIIKKEKTLI